MKTCHGYHAFTADPMQKQPHHSCITMFVIMLTLLVMGPFTLFADFNYTISDGEATITEYTGPGGAVEIPSVLADHPVVHIGDFAFRNHETVTSVIIPDGVKSVGDRAFQGCDQLTSVTMPDSITAIGIYAFSDCTSLTSIQLSAGLTTIPNGLLARCESLVSVTLPDGVTSIGHHAFVDCTGLTSLTIPSSVRIIESDAFSGCSSLAHVTIPEGLETLAPAAFRGCSGLVTIELPASLTSIGTRAFQNCPSLEAINVHAANPFYSSVDGILFNKNQTVLIRYPETKAGDYTIPFGITEIAGWAFDLCSDLTAITIPATVNKIGYQAFGRCSSLTSIVIPANVTTLDSFAFFHCTSLASITLPAGLTSIGNSAFYGCTSLASIELPAGLISISPLAFYQCTSLASIMIPANVTSIADSAFRHCTNLYAIDVDEANTVYSSLDGVMFSKDRTRLLRFPAGKAGHYTIPETVTVIEGDAFRDNAGLTGVDIPDSVTEIGVFAFRDCTHLTAVLFAGDAPEYGSQIFRDADQVIVYRRAAATGWPAPGEPWAGRPTTIWGIDAEMWPAGGVELVGRRPAFNWPTTQGATWYRIWINRNGATYLDEWVQGSPPWTPAEALPSGNYSWWIQPWSLSTGSGIWSAAAEFSVRVLAPSTPPTLLAPIGDVSDTRRPAFTWSSVPDATYYRVYVQVVGGDVVIDQWITHDTSLTPSADLPAGEYRWWVMPWGPDGAGPWSTGQTFSLVAQIPGTLALIAPEGVQTEHDLAYRWSRDAHATWYCLWIGTEGGTVWHENWHAATADAEQSVMLQDHPQGNFVWWVRGWAPDGNGPWSGPMTFSTPSHTPAKTVLVGPTGMIADNPPTFEWEAAARAEWYRIYIQRGSVKVIDQWIQADPELDIDSWAPLSAFYAGEHSWWVGSWNQKTKVTIWSDRMNFTVP